MKVFSRYSTEHGRLCPGCGQPKAACTCTAQSTATKGRWHRPGRSANQGTQGQRRHHRQRPGPGPGSASRPDIPPEKTLRCRGRPQGWASSKSRGSTAIPWCRPWRNLATPSNGWEAEPFLSQVHRQSMRPALWPCLHGNGSSGPDAPWRPPRFFNPGETDHAPLLPQSLCRQFSRQRTPVVQAHHPRLFWWPTPFCSTPTAPSLPAGC